MTTIRILLALLLLSGPAWAGVPGVPRVQGITGGDTLQPDATASNAVMRSVINP